MSKFLNIYVPDLCQLYIKIGLNSSKYITIEESVGDQYKTRFLDEKTGF